MQCSPLPKAFSILWVTLVVISLVLRFSNLDTKVFWHDEAYTAIPVSGHQRSQIRDDLFQQVLNQQAFTPADFQRYQVPDPNTTMGDTLNAVAAEEPQNSPLYFILARFWLELTHFPPILGLRLLSGLIGLLLLPGVYWLCRQLFQSGAIAGVSVILCAVSPLHLLYAQEARQYSLLTVLAVWSSVALLRAIRLHRSSHWLLYAFSAMVGLYTQPFFLFVLVAHGVYTLFCGKFQLRRMAYYLGAMLLSGLAFSPWLQIIWQDRDAISDWRGANTLPLMGLVGRWLLNLCHSVVDFHLGDRYNYDLPFSLTHPYLYGALGIFGLGAYAFVHLIRTTNRETWLMVVCLAIFPTLFLAAADLTQGGIRSTIPRYILPSFVGVQLAIAYALGERIFSGALSVKGQQMWRSLLAIILTLGLVSQMQISPAQTWWNKYSNYYDPEIAALINAVPQPGLLSEGTVRMVSLSYLLRPDVVIQTTKKDQPLQLHESSTLFIYDVDTSAQLLVAQIREQYGLAAHLVYHQPLGFINNEIQLWEVEFGSLSIYDSSG